MIAAMLQSAGDRQDDLATRILDDDFDQVAPARLPGIGKCPLGRCSRNTVIASVTGAGMGIKTGDRGTFINAWIIATYHPVQRFEVEHVVASPDNDQLIRALTGLTVQPENMTHTSTSACETSASAHHPTLDKWGRCCRRWCLRRRRCSSWCIGRSCC